MSVAKSYANALYGAALDAGFKGEQLNQIESELEQFEKAIETSPGAQSVLYAPITTAKEKSGFVNEVAKGFRFSPLTTHFLMLLASKGRFSSLAAVREAFNSARLAAEGGISADLVSAEPMDRADIESLAQSFGKKLGKKVVFKVSEDSTLLAGMRVTVGGVTYDGSLRSQLERLRDRFVSGFKI